MAFWIKCCYVLVVLSAVVVGILWDIRDSSVKEDSILFKTQLFDQRLELGTRHAYIDLPLKKTEKNSKAKEEKHAKKSPIMFLIHGKASNADDMKTLFGFDAAARAKKEGFIVVYPVGVINKGTRTWNAGSVDAHNNENDVEYFRQIVKHLADKFDGDKQSVFLSGMSNGGFMTNRLACAWASDRNTTGNPLGIKVRAIVPTLGGLAKMKYDKLCGGDAHKIGVVPIPVIRVFDQEKCPYTLWKAAPSHFECEVTNLPVLVINNAADLLVPLSGVIINQAQELYPPVEFTLRYYAEANGCDYSPDNTYRTKTFHGVSPTDKEDFTTCHSLNSCKANTTLCVSVKSGHNWVTATNGDEPPMPSRFFKWLMSPYARSMDTNSQILDFFFAHRA